MRPLLFALVFPIAVAVSSPFAAADTAILAGGCFWCVEADFDKVPGVTSTVSGYSGGATANPTYKTYEDGGHREVVRIEFDPAKVSYRALVDVFLRSVDITDAGGQFCDRGHAYSTAIYALDDDQAAAAKAAIADGEKVLGREIATPVERAGRFWPAEDYHQNYYRSEERILTRFGYVTRASAYKGYREACGRDERVKDVWGKEAYRGLPQKGS